MKISKIKKDIMPKTESEWKEKLTPEQYNILRKAETERPYTSSLLKEKRKGVFTCMACGNELFDSSTKFDSGTGWPSFYGTKIFEIFVPRNQKRYKKFRGLMNNKAVKLKTDYKIGIPRTEVLCGKCGSHLGHLFNDAPQTPTGKRYCINGCALNFKEKSS